MANISQSRETLERVFREEYGRIIATLIRISGSFDLAEEALQEAFTSATSKWEIDGSPDNPGAWLTTVAHRRLLDALRRDRTRTDKQAELAYEANRLQPYVEPELEDPVEYSDDRLRLIFTCCHPSLTREAQVALTLKTLGGLTTGEIAHAFLLSETTLAQRLVRAKQKIRLARIPYEIPSLERIADRLAAVQAVIYLIFNEGYAASTGRNLIRNDLCAEAIRLGRVLCELLPDEPENLGLLALMLLQNSRRDARVNKQGELVTLDEQDRSLWSAGEIEEGVHLVQRALHMRRIGSYQLQAAIAAVHAEAKTADKTDWRQIVALYEELIRITSSPIVALNHAAAVAMSEGFERGLSLIEAVGADGALQNYYLYHASRADLLRRLRRFDEAIIAYAKALSLTTNEVEQNYIRRRINEIHRLHRN